MYFQGNNSQMGVGYNGETQALEETHSVQYHRCVVL